MANKIKFTTGTVSGSLSKGNVRISTGGVSGPTHDTGFFNGIVPPEGGYVIYAKKEGIVEDGLVFAIDPSNKSSYRPDLGLNKVWDLSGNDNDGNLINGVGYSVDDEGSFTFDGVNDYISTYYGSGYNVGLNSLTIGIWVKYISGSSMYMAFGDTTGNRRAYFGVNGGLWDMGIQNSYWGLSPTGGSRPSSTTNWSYITVVFDNSELRCKFYLNGVEHFYKSYTTYQLLTTLSLGAWNNGSSYFWNGNISNVFVYNRSLSDTEILQNYNTTKGRFGI